MPTFNSRRMSGFMPIPGSIYDCPIKWSAQLSTVHSLGYSILSTSIVLQCHFNIYFNVTSISTSISLQYLLQYHFNIYFNITSISTSMSLQYLTTFWCNRFYSIIKILFTILPNRVIKRHLRLVNKNDMDRHLCFKVYFCFFVLGLIYRFYNLVS